MSSSTSSSRSLPPRGVGKGTGLGFEHGVMAFMSNPAATISVYSEVGQGTVFKLFLPLAPGAESHADPAAAGPRADRQAFRASRDPGGGTTIRTFARPSWCSLKGLGYRSARPTMRAVPWTYSTARTESTSCSPTLVMPGSLNGKELATQARIKRPDLKGALTFGFSRHGDRPGTKFDDADVLLSKPLPASAIWRRRVEAILAAQP